MRPQPSGHRSALNVLASPEDINRSSGPFSSPMHASARAAERRRRLGDCAASGRLTKQGPAEESAAEVCA